MKPTRFLLLRHGEPEHSARGRVYGALDVALSDQGRAEARRVAQRLEKVDAVYSSPRRRALETAQIVAPGAQVQVEPALRELDFGLFEGLSYDEAAAREPDFYRRWMETPTEVSFPGGESWPDLRERVTRLAATLRARHATQTVLLVAHGGPLRALLVEALGLPDANLFRIDQSFAGLSIIDWFEALPLVRSINGAP